MTLARVSCASATQTLAWAAATISGRASESRKAVARLIGKPKSVGSSGAGLSRANGSPAGGGRCGRSIRLAARLRRLAGTSHAVAAASTGGRRGALRTASAAEARIGRRDDGCSGRDAEGRRRAAAARRLEPASRVARMTVNPPIRSIGRGSFPVPPDRSLQRSDSGLTGRQRLYRLIAMRMLMTNAAILSPHSDPLAGPELGVAAKVGEIGLLIWTLCPMSGRRNQDRSRRSRPSAR